MLTSWKRFNKISKMESFRPMVWETIELTLMHIVKFGRTYLTRQQKSMATSVHSHTVRKGLIQWCLSANNVALKQMHFLSKIRIDKGTLPLCSRTSMEILSRVTFSVAQAKGRENKWARKEATWPGFRRATPSTSLRSSSLFARRNSWRSKLWPSLLRATLPLSLM